MNQQPPKWAEKLLLLFLKGDLAEEVLGDLDEKYYSVLEKKSLRKAKLNYWYQVFNYLRPFAIKYFRSNSILVTMVKHNLLVSYRVLLKNKVFSLINIGGLALGMTIAILIGLWIHDEYSFNKNHEHYDRIVQVLRKDTDDGVIEVNSSLVSKLGDHLRDTYPTLFENVSMTFYRNQEQFLSVGKRSIERVGYFFNKDISDLLSLDMVSGTGFNEANLDAILLSESLAKTLFPDENPVGKNVRINTSRDLIVSGVYKDLPKNSTFNNMAYIIPMELVYDDEDPPTWSNYNTKVYALLNPGIDIDYAQNLIKDALNDNIPEENGPIDLMLIGMKDWHLNSTFEDGVQVTGRRAQIVKLYGVIGVFVLFLAFINFINLNTARCNNRMKEIGIRKSIGSYRGQLIQQFLAESFLYAFASLLISLLLVSISLELFNDLAGKEMVMPWSSPMFWVLILVFMLTSGLVAGAYPAFFLSSFNPVKALRGSIKQGVTSTRFRQVLVVFQFSISIALIIGTITVYKQISFAKARPVGYDQSDLLTMRGRSSLWYDNFNVLRDELLKTGNVVEIACANYPLTNDLGNNNGFLNSETGERYPITFNTIIVTPEYGQAIGWELVAGRSFARDQGDESQNIIVSEEAVELMGMTDPIGKIVRSNRSYFGRENSFKIIGVVKDMVKRSPFSKTKPLMMFSTERALGHAFIRLNPTVDYLESIPEINEVFEEVMPGYPFNYEFLDDSYQLKFQAEERIGSLAMIFSVFAILISCLGLFGLSAYVVEQRTKEIGIRKVLGASVGTLWRLLTKDFSVLVIASCFFAVPIAFYFLGRWLESFEYGIELSWWIFAVAILLGFVIALSTISVHALKASTANPVNALRSE